MQRWKSLITVVKLDVIFIISTETFGKIFMNVMTLVLVGGHVIFICLANLKRWKQYIGFA